MSGPRTAGTEGGRSRRRILRDGLAGVLAVGAVLEGRGLVAPADAALSRQDAKILNFLLELERLQTSFFDRARGDKRFSVELRQFATVTARQDQAHVDALRSLLGSAAKATTAQLKADPHDDASFVRDALALKEAAVAAYIGEAPNLAVPRITPVAGIVSVEARHAAWIRSVAAVIPAPRAADRSQTPGTVVRSLEGSGLATVR